MNQDKLKILSEFFKKLWFNKSSRTGFILVLLVGLCALFAPFITDYQPNVQNLNQSLQPPGKEHLLGTDFFGRDLFTRIIYGARISLGISLFATFLSTILGVGIGIIAGYFGKIYDKIAMRIINLLLGFPKLPVFLIFAGLGGTSVKTLILFMSLFSWMELARISRAETMSVKTRPYIKSAIALGLRKRTIFLKYIIPNIIGPIIASATLLISSMILLEAALSFLGFGVQTPIASWGTILYQGKSELVNGWWISFFGGIVIVITVIGFNLLGDGLRIIFEPKSKS